ncbi:uncharacterized protein EV420DRAFT_1476482 [Desarmillaria tabescens]|uniref:Uncharacterized protein n=1 Tax=Armillaria tabescens TaxID=1929756 RepID=A0AA39NDU5_ARMTA|nr:uncharacterized protein EV420DRAFT_1476482 [Desarmillaria tabescens]KAK0463825.1 hypothetical protein EV420DRAFT_1476482 [Desarmillaria tabescens]
MLLKFANSDFFQSPLIDVDTGDLMYNIVTVHHTEDQDKLVVLLKNPQGKAISKIVWVKPNPSMLFNFQRLYNVSAVIDQDDVQDMESAVEDGVIRIPTRFDTEYFWIVGADSLTLYDVDSDTTKGRFYFNCSYHPDAPKKFVPAIGPLGHHYLDFPSHDLAHDTEIILTFLLLEVYRRGIFSLPWPIFIFKNKESINLKKKIDAWRARNKWRCS